MKIFAEEWLPQIPDFHVKPGAEIRYRAGFTMSYANLPLVLKAS